MALSSSFSSSVSSAGSSSTAGSVADSSTSTPSSASRQWRVPGPSTRYHKSEHARPKPTPRNSHTRNLSSMSTRSSYQESSASPLARLNFASTSANSSASPSRPNAPANLRNTPLTPVRSPNFRNSRHFGSPYSDYFTDDAHSMDNHLPYHSSDTAQKLLLRLNNLGSDILRLELSEDIVSEFSEKLFSLEAIVQDSAYSDEASVTEDTRGGRRHSFDALGVGEQGRDTIRSPNVSHRSTLSEVWSAAQRQYADSSVQTVEKDVELKAEDKVFSDPTCEHAESSTQTEVEAEQKHQVDSGICIPDTSDYKDSSTQTTNDRLVADLQDVVQRLAKANDSLRRRHDQSKQLSDSQAVQLEELSTKIMCLKSENDNLKSDIGFDHSELLFLKLQLQAIEVQTHDSDRGTRVLLADDLAKWKADWDNVDARLRTRREKNRVPSAALPQELVALEAEANAGSEDPGQWQLETRKQHHGRVRSITLKRLDGAEIQDDEATLVNSEYDIPLSPTNKPVYCEQATQTESLSEDDYEDEEEDEDEEDASDAEDNLVSKHQPTRVEIITKYEQLCRACGNEVDYSSEEDEPTTKTPWQELCDGLSAFAGMQRD